MLLAAGASARMGRPKQSLQYNGQTLLQHTLQVASEAAIGPIAAVLGANAVSIAKQLSHTKADVITNAAYADGMASSIVCGLQYMLVNNPQTDGVLFMLCDQPFVSAALLLQLGAAQRSTGKPIAASSYQQILGTPALFHQSIFEELLQLKGDTGAKKLIQQHAADTTAVPFPEGAIDIDTMDDYEKLLQV